MSGFDYDGKVITRDPDDVLDYVIDATGWLNGDTLSSVSFTVKGVTVDSCSINAAPVVVNPTRTIAVGRAVVFWLSGGWPGVDGEITIHITTSGGRQIDRTYQINTASA